MRLCGAARLLLGGGDAGAIGTDPHADRARVHVQANRVAGVDLTAKDRVRERSLDEARDRSPHRTSAERRLEAAAAEQVLDDVVAEVEADSAIDRERLAHAVEKPPSDLAHLGPREGS